VKLEEPCVCHLGGTEIDERGLGYFLKALGARVLLPENFGNYGPDAVAYRKFCQAIADA
jgi:hypothetical protein